MDANQFLAMFAQLNWLKTVGIGIGITILYYLGPFNDGSGLNNQLASLQQQYAEAEKDIAATKEALANADRFEREVKDTVDQFGRITEFMPEKINGSELIALVSDLCKKSGLKLIKVEPKPGGDRVEFYETSKVQFAFEGTFAQVVALLGGLTKTPKLMTIEDFVLEMAQGNTDQETPRLSATGTLLGYRYIRPAVPAEPKPGDANGSTGSK